MSFFISFNFVNLRSDWSGRNSDLAKKVMTKVLRRTFQVRLIHETMHAYAMIASYSSSKKSERQATEATFRVRRTAHFNFMTDHFMLWSDICQSLEKRHWDRMPI